MQIVHIKPEVLAIVFCLGKAQKRSWLKDTVTLPPPSGRFNHSPLEGF